MLVEALAPIESVSNDYSPAVGHMPTEKQTLMQLVNNYKANRYVNKLCYQPKIYCKPVSIATSNESDRVSANALLTIIVYKRQ